MPKFIILHSENIYDLQKFINEHITQGYNPLGAILAVPKYIKDGENIKYDYYQSVVK